MSQHLLAAARLSDGFGSELLRQGYPMGPHAIVVGLDKGLGVSLVEGFTGLTVAVAVIAPLTALAAFPERPPLRRAAAALLVGLPYLVASYFAQGAFKETMQALWVLAFILALRETTRNPELARAAAPLRPRRGDRGRRRLHLQLPGVDLALGDPARLARARAKAAGAAAAAGPRRVRGRCPARARGG